MRLALKYITLLLGAICIIIALLHIAFGPAVIPSAGPINATMDSKDRFYSSMFLGFGAAMMWCGLNLQDRGPTFKALLLVFSSAASRGLSRQLKLARLIHSFKSCGP